MNQSSVDRTDPATMRERERELELEIARLKAELEASKGADAGEAASRFLTLAANTVDAAMEDARREADELVTEVTADAEARRDEATRLAAEAEARADAMRVEAENHESIVTAAQETAGQIRADAEAEAANLVAVERARVVEEIESLSEVRASLEGEREALETYHGELRRRVQELAESMVNFMTTEPPLAACAALEELAAPEIDTTPLEESTAPEQTRQTTEPAVVEQFASLEDVINDSDEDVAEEIASEDVASEEVAVEVEAEAGIFDGVPVVESVGDDGAFDVLDEVPPAPQVPTSGGLFSRASEDETAGERSGLFGTHGFRLVQQTNTDELAEALGDEDEADAAFESFLAGDSEADASRDWLLRNDRT